MSKSKAPSALRDFAAQVQAMVDRMPVDPALPVLGPRNVFISRAWAAFRVASGWNSVEAFKARLVECHTAGLLVLVRADLVAAMPEHEVVDSETCHLEARYNFVERTEAAVKAAAAAAPASRSVQRRQAVQRSELAPVTAPASPTRGELTRAGQKRAQASGTHIGRPRTMGPAVVALARQLREGGASWQNVAREIFGTATPSSVSAVRRACGAI